jgi:hypothetical protein
MEFLSEIEKERIANKFNGDEILSGAVKKVLLAVIYNNGVLKAGEAPDPLRNGALGLAFLAISGKGVVTNADLGEDLRGMAQGISLLEQGYRQLESIKQEVVDESVESPYLEAQ